MSTTTPHHTQFFGETGRDQTGPNLAANIGAVALVEPRSGNTIRILASLAAITAAAVGGVVTFSHRGSDEIRPGTVAVGPAVAGKGPATGGAVAPPAVNIKPSTPGKSASSEAAPPSGQTFDIPPDPSLYDGIKTQEDLRGIMEIPSTLTTPEDVVKGYLKALAAAYNYGNNLTKEQINTNWPSNREMTTQLNAEAIQAFRDAIYGGQEGTSATIVNIEDIRNILNVPFRNQKLNGTNPNIPNLAVGFSVTSMDCFKPSSGRVQCQTTVSVTSNSNESLPDASQIPLVGAPSNPVISLEQVGDSWISTDPLPSNP